MMKFDHQSQLLDQFPVEENQEENPLASSSKLRIKLKVKVKVKSETTTTTTTDDHKKDINNGGGRSDCICKNCSKRFKSSKALGGHMRIHVEEQRALSGKGNGNGDGTPPTCLVCKKTFLTLKSLHGHMRCHPDRPWRGMVPPSSATAKAPDQDQDQDLQDEDEDEDEDFYGAVNGLMLLSTGEDRYRIHPNNADDADKDEIDYNPPSAGKKRKREETSGKCYSCSICNKSFPSPQALGGHTSSAHNKVFMRNEVRQDDANYNSNVKQEDFGHLCGICHKVFPTGQALGGHKRCHWPGLPSPEEAQPEPTNRELPAFDLNQIPDDHHLVDQQETSTM